MKAIFQKNTIHVLLVIKRLKSKIEEFEYNGVTPLVLF